MEVLLLFLIVFLGTSILFRMPVGFSIGLGGVVTLWLLQHRHGPVGLLWDE